MAIRRFKTAEEMAQEQQQAFSWQRHLPTDKLLIIYARQSSKEQVIKNKEAARQQTDELIQFGIACGWSEGNWKLFVENYFMRNGQVTDKARSAPGRLRIEERGGLTIVTNMIESGEVDAILVWAVDRLFRDEDMVEPAVFARLCKEHMVIVLTKSDMYDFSKPHGDDLDRFLAQAREAANYNKHHIKGRVLPARYNVALRGEYAGQGVPVGLMLDSERKHFLPSPHAPHVSALYERFRQLNGNFAALRREVIGKPIFPDVPEEVLKKMSKIRLTKIPGGWTVKDHEALRAILTNPCYIGHVVWDRRIVKRNAHPAIVDEEDFWFAFNRLSDTDFDGLPIEHPEHVVRYHQTHGVPSDALLWGVRSNGQAVLTSPGKSVHTHQEAGNNHSPAYVIYDTSRIAVSRSVAAILVSRLDAIFTDRLLYRVASDAINYGVRCKDGTPLEERAEGWYAHFQQVQQEVEVSLNLVDTSIDEARKALARAERDRDIASSIDDVEQVRECMLRIKRLHLQLTDLERRQAEKRVSDEKMRETAHDVASLPDSWQKMKLEQKRRLISHITERIELEEVAEGWLRFSIHWTRYFQYWNVVDVAYIWRPKAGKAWSDEEEQIVKEHYATVSRAWLLEQLPRRSWQGIRRHASLAGIDRVRQTPDTDLSDTISLLDKQVMDKYGLTSETAYRKSAYGTYWWKAVKSVSTINCGGRS